MTRSGSSAAVYASAQALGFAVADEPFGPWDRTKSPYNYPPEQVDLHKLHLSHNEKLCDETRELAEHVLHSSPSNSRATPSSSKCPTP